MILNWSNTLDADKGKWYGHIDNAVRTAGQIGYEALCWNHRIYLIEKQAKGVWGAVTTNYTRSDISNTAMPSIEVDALMSESEFVIKVTHPTRIGSSVILSTLRKFVRTIPVDGVQVDECGLVITKPKRT